MVKVSVIIPFHESGKHLVKCLDSLLNQQFKDYEVLLIDDCAKDIAVEVAELYHRQYYPRIKHYKLKERGYEHGARQYGFEISEGNIIFQGDSGFTYPKEFLREMVNTLTNEYQRDCMVIGVIQTQLGEGYGLRSIRKDNGGMMCYKTAIVESGISYKNHPCGTDRDYIQQLEDAGYTLVRCQSTYTERQGVDSIIEVYRGHAKFFKTCGRWYGKQDELYKFKRLISFSLALLFPLSWLFNPIFCIPYVPLMLVGERKMYYTAAIKNRDIKGILSIFFNNWMKDIASVHYFIGW